MKRIFSLSILLISIFYTTNCTTVNKGYGVEEDTDEEMIEMANKNASIQEFMEKFGSPSFINAPKNDTICYVYAKGKQIAFNRFYKPIHQYICITFENNVAKSYEQKSLTKINKVKMKKFDTKFEKPL